MQRHAAITLAILLLFASCQKHESSTTKVSSAAAAPAAADPAAAAPAAAAPTAADPAANLKAAYALCAEYKDFVSAAPLAYQLCVAEPAQAGKWKEELAKIHFATQRHSSCLKVVTDLTANHGGAEKIPLLEMAALCQEALGKKAEATAAWKAAWAKSASSSHAVRLAGLQYETGALDEAEASIYSGLGAADAKTATIPLPKTREQMQQIPVAAALHNLKAMLTIKKDPTAKQAAKLELNAALALAPEFEIAKRNLKELETPPSPETPKTPETPETPEKTAEP
jgi:hypothetical protein